MRHSAVRWAVTVGAGYMALAIGAGAFGAHGLRGHLDPPALALWETAARYLFYGGVGLVLLGLAWLLSDRQAGALTDPPSAGRWSIAAWSLAAGTALFATTVGALALGAPRFLGAITPLGGVAMILGLLVFAWAARPRGISR